MTDLYTTPLKGSIALSTALHTDHNLLKDNSLYKFIWITEGTATLIVDHIKTVIRRMILSLLHPYSTLYLKKLKENTKHCSSIATFTAFSDMTTRSHVMDYFSGIMVP